MREFSRRRKAEPFTLDEFMEDRKLKQYRFIDAYTMRDGKRMFSIEIYTGTSYRAQGSRMIGLEEDLCQFVLTKAPKEFNKDFVVREGRIETLSGAILEDLIKEYEKSKPLSSGLSRP